jgi:hypothetical protein
MKPKIIAPAMGLAISGWPRAISNPTAAAKSHNVKKMLFIVSTAVLALTANANTIVFNTFGPGHSYNRLAVTMCKAPLWQASKK